MQMYLWHHGGGLSGVTFISILGDPGAVSQVGSPAVTNVSPEGQEPITLWTPAKVSPDPTDCPWASEDAIHSNFFSDFKSYPFLRPISVYHQK